MATRLRVRRLDRVGFVDKGDDPEAEIVFFKRAETFGEVGEGDQAVNKGGKRMAEFDISKLSTDDQAAVGKIQTEADKVAGLEEELATVRADLAKATATPASTVETEEDVMKGLAPEVKEMIEKLQTEADESRTTTNELVEKLAAGELEKFAKTELSDLSGDLADQVRVLRTIQKALDEPKDFEAVQEMFKAASASVKAADVLKREIGASDTTPAGGDAFAKATALAADLMKADPKKYDTIQKAIAHVLRTDGDLAREYEQERSAQA